MPWWGSLEVKYFSVVFTFHSSKLFLLWVLLVFEVFPVVSSSKLGRSKVSCKWIRENRDRSLSIHLPGLNMHISLGPFLGGPFGDDFIFFTSLFGMILGFFQTSQTNPSWHYWGLRTKGYKEMIFGNP